MLKIILASLLFVTSLALSNPISASDDGEVADYAYFGFSPDIVTNYISPDNKIGFVRISMEVMVKSSDHVAIIEHHAPLLRAAIVNLLGQQSERQIKSPTGKTEIRALCFEIINELLKKETGHELATSVLITKYIYH